MVRVQNIKDVCISPYSFIHGIFHGGIEAEANCAFGKIIGGKTARECTAPRADPVCEIAGHALYAGPLWNHFGHILVDSLHRLWALDGHDVIVFAGVTGLRGVRSADELASWQPPKVLFDMLEMIGISTPIKVITEPTLCRNLDVPEPGAAWKNGVQPWYFEHLRRYQSGIEGRVGSIKPASDRMYFSRTHMLAEGGIAGSSYIDKVLAASGVEIVQPEKHSLAEQFANLLNGKRILFDEGSSVHLTELLARTETKFYMLPRRRNDGIFGRALRPRAPYAQLTPGSNVSILPDRRGRPATTQSLSVFHDPTPVLAAVRKAGLLKVSVDLDEYHAMEMDAVRTARANTPAIRQRRIEMLSDLRNALPVRGAA